MDAWFLFFLATLFCLVSTGQLDAQERVRTAAGRLKIESFRNPEAFFRLGPLQEELIGSAGIEFTDNSQLTNTDKVSRLRFFQGLNLNTTWVISHLNQLKFDFAGQLNEDFYGNGKSQVSVSISPDSLLEFQFAVSNFRVRLFDRFSYVQDPTENPTATNTANLNSLTNTVGAVVDTDLNLAILSFSGDYTYNDQSGSNAEGQNNPDTTGTRHTIRLGTSVSIPLKKEMFYGLEVTASRSTGSGGGNAQGSSNVNSLNIGPFIRGKLSPRTDFDLAGGVSLFDTNPSIPPNYYLNAVLKHRFNRNLQLFLSAAHDLIFTTATDLTEETTFRAGAEVGLTRFITFTTFPFFNFGEEKTGNAPGNFSEYGIEATLAWRPHRRWKTALTYDHIHRSADLSTNSYVRNLVSFQLSYAF